MHMRLQIVALLLWLLAVATLVAAQRRPNHLSAFVAQNHVAFQAYRCLATTRRHGTEIRSTVAKDDSSQDASVSSSSSSLVQIQYNPFSLQHLAATELPDESRPWTATKVKALALAVACGVVSGGIAFVATSADFSGDDSRWVLVGAVGIAAGWQLLGGRQVQEDERPRNGGYDRKLLADKPSRLRAVVADFVTPRILAKEDGPTRSYEELEEWVRRVHADAYVDELKTKCLETDRPVRLNPLFSRTLIDQSSWYASLQAVDDWLDSVHAAAAAAAKPKFALVRPPGHHACVGGGMGGCLVNNAAIAAQYALAKGLTKRVAILDMDAHHGNGIAHCIQQDNRIRFVSLHEESSTFYVTTPSKARTEADPRSPDESDQGPLGNICNLNLPPGTTWDKGYRQALVERAIPFLRLDDNDDGGGGSEDSLLLVAAGFDALDRDRTSGLRLQPSDFHLLGQELRKVWNNRVAFGLEGGYCYQDGELSHAIEEFVRAWDAS